MSRETDQIAEQTIALRARAEAEAEPFAYFLEQRPEPGEMPAPVAESPAPDGAAGECYSKGPEPADESPAPTPEEAAAGFAAADAAALVDAWRELDGPGKAAVAALATSLMTRFSVGGALHRAVRAAGAAGGGDEWDMVVRQTATDERLERRLVALEGLVHSQRRILLREIKRLGGKVAKARAVGLIAAHVAAAERAHASDKATPAAPSSLMLGQPATLAAVAAAGRASIWAMKKGASRGLL